MTAQAQKIWIVDLNDIESRFESKVEMATHLDGLEKLPDGRLSLMVDHGPVTGWRRVFGVKRDVSGCFSVEWYSHYASLIFLGDSWSEYRVRDTARPVQSSDDDRTRIAHGEFQAHPIDECMEKGRAFTAIREYLKTGERPTWLTYKFVS
jgi:hypothetical protein